MEFDKFIDVIESDEEEAATVFRGKQDAQSDVEAVSEASNRITLDATLADLLNSMLDDEGEARTKLALLASDIRHQYLDEHSGKYVDEFKGFWVRFRMEETFGKLPQFTKYALAGELIQRVEERHAQHKAVLPNSIKALYAMSQLSDDELREFLQSRSTSRKAGLRITDGEVTTWRKAKRAKAPQDDDVPFIALATIKIHGSFGRFAEDGSYIGKIGRDEVVTLIAAIKDVVSEYGATLVQVETQSANLLKRYAREARRCMN